MVVKDFINLLNLAKEQYQFDLAVLVNVYDENIVVVNDEKLVEYQSLYNSLFYDSSAIHDLYENLKISILPQMVKQGNKFCFLGMIGPDYIYAVFGTTELNVKDKYYLSKEIDSFIQNNVKKDTDEI